jgi:PAT family beta-lactamase induction signal transducer AmpG
MEKNKNMADINKNKILKHFLFSSLYFSEGLQWSIAIVIIPLYLTQQGISPGITTVTAGIVSSPMILKFIFGGVTDYYGRLGRKYFVLLGGFSAVACLFIVGFIDPGIALIPFTVILFIAHCGIGFLDVSADAWAIETTTVRERGKINGFMFGGLFIGTGLGSFLFTQIGSDYGYNTVFFTAGLITLLIILFPLLFKETIKFKKRPKVAHLVIGDFKRKIIQLVALFGPISSISGGLIVIAIPLYTKNILNLSDPQTGLITLLFMIATIFGAIIGGTLADIWGRKRVLYITLIGSMIFTALLAFADTWQILAVIYVIVGFLFGGLFTASCALMMDITKPSIAATQFAVLTALFNLGEIGIGNTIAGSLIETIGYTRLFLYAGLLYGFSLIIVYLMKINKK